jgi:hypothetical protein
VGKYAQARFLADIELEREPLFSWVRHADVACCASQREAQPVPARRFVLQPRPRRDKSANHSSAGSLSRRFFFVFADSSCRRLRARDFGSRRGANAQPARQRGSIERRRGAARTCSLDGSAFRVVAAHLTAVGGITVGRAVRAVPERRRAAALAARTVAGPGTAQRSAAAVVFALKNLRLGRAARRALTHDAVRGFQRAAPTSRTGRAAQRPLRRGRGRCAGPRRTRP